MFLERLGCLWLTPDAEIVPEKTGRSIAPFELCETPTFNYRSLWVYPVDDLKVSKWMLRNRMNGIICDTPEEWGGRVDYYDFVHTFFRLVPPDTYFDSHPEWFSERNGKRFWKGGQLCCTNPELREFLINKIREIVQDNPDVDYISISQNDHGGRCLCKDCLAMEEREESAQGPVLFLVNGIAKALESEFPGITFTTLAYRWSRKSPRTIVPRHNVNVRLCGIECDFTESLSEASSVKNMAFVEDLKGWVRISSSLSIWDYVSLSSANQPYPNYHVLDTNLRMYRDLGIEAVFCQGSVFALGEMRAWTLCQLMWNVDADVNELYREFALAYYGAAAPFLLDYVHQVTALCLRKKIQLRPNSPVSSAFVDYDFLERAEQYFAQAGESVRGDPCLSKRVEEARVPLRMFFAGNWDFLWQKAKIEKRAWPGPASFRDNALAVNEFYPNKTDGDAINVDEVHPVSLPEELMDLAPEQFMDIQDSEFWIKEPSGTRQFKDAMASDGIATLIPRARHRYTASIILMSPVLLAMVLGPTVSSRCRHSRRRIKLAMLGVVICIVVGYVALFFYIYSSLSGSPSEVSHKVVLHRSLAIFIGSLLFFVMLTLGKENRTAGLNKWVWLAICAGAGMMAFLIACVCLSHVASALHSEAYISRRIGTLVKEPSFSEEAIEGAAIKAFTGVRRFVEYSHFERIADLLLQPYQSAIDPAWSIARPFSSKRIQEEVPYECQISIRNRGAGNRGKVQLGIYDPYGRKSILVKRIPLSEISATDYCSTSLYVKEMSRGYYVWLKSSSSDLSVDRMLLVRQ
jgi:hypothetical protein